MWIHQLKQRGLFCICGFVVLFLGLIAGFWIGQSWMGQYFPEALAIGTILAFIAALYEALSKPVPVKKAADFAIFFILCLLLCALVLGISVSATATHQLQHSDRVAGFIPYSDAAGYFHQVISWPSETLDGWNSRRPLNAVFNILEFQLGFSSLLGMILVRVALAALAVSSFIAILATVTGRYAALTAGFTLLFWTWPYASSLLSEINGITISAAAYALLLLSMIQKQYSFAFLGLSAVVLAFCFRPYNPLMPAIFALGTTLTIAVNYRKSLKYAALVALIFTFMAASLPWAIYSAYGHKDGAVHGNTGYSVLGLARGTDWAEAGQYVALNYPAMTESESNKLMFELAFRTVQTDPKLLAKALLNNLLSAIWRYQVETRKTFGFPEHSGFGQWQQRTHWAIALIALREPLIWVTFLYFIVSTIAIPKVFKSYPAVVIVFGLSLITYITFAPVAFGDGGWRSVATLYPGLTIITVILPLWIRITRDKQFYKNTEIKQDKQLVRSSFSLAVIPVLMICFVIAALPYPALARYYGQVISPKERKYQFTVEIESQAKSRWLSLNEAVITPANLINWAAENDLEDWTAYFESQGHQFIRIIVDKEQWILQVKDQDSVRQAKNLQPRLFNVITVDDSTLKRSFPLKQ